MEVVGWYLTHHTSIGMCQARKLMIFFDVINALQGFFLFLVFYFDKERTSLLWNQCLNHLKRQEENNTPRGRTRTISTCIHTKKNIEHWFSLGFWTFNKCFCILGFVINNHFTLWLFVFLSLNYVLISVILFILHSFTFTSQIYSLHSGWNLFCKRWWRKLSFNKRARYKFLSRWNIIRKF